MRLSIQYNTINIYTFNPFSPKGFWGVFFVLFFVFLHFVVPMGISPMENVGRFPQGKPAPTVALPNPNESACWVFSCLHNPPNSDMYYRIFNMRTWLFLCVRVHTGGGIGHTDSESVHFWLGKALTIYSVLLTQARFEPPIFGSRIRRSNNWATLYIYQPTSHALLKKTESYCFHFQQML